MLFRSMYVCSMSVCVAVCMCVCVSVYACERVRVRRADHNKEDRQGVAAPEAV